MSRKTRLLWVGGSYPIFAASLVLFHGCAATPQEDTAGQAAEKLVTTRDQLFSVAAMDPDHVWVVGDFGLILHSDTGGTRWLLQASGTRRALLAVDFADPQHGWAVGESGTIVATSDGGAHWKEQRSGTKNRLLAVDFVTPEKGTAVGSFGTILCTQDGGTHWNDRSLGEDVTLNDVCFVTPAHGWVVGEFGTILTTRDGGLHWTRQASGEKEASLFGVCFPDDRHGWCVGQDGLILATRDGGHRWTPYKERFTKSLFDVAVNPWMGIVVGADGLVLEKGASWGISKRVGAFSWLREVALAGQNGWIVGDMGVILYTSDGGKHWQPARIEPQALGTARAPDHARNP